MFYKDVHSYKLELSIIFLFVCYGFQKNKIDN